MSKRERIDKVCNINTGLGMIRVVEGGSIGFIQNTCIKSLEIDLSEAKETESDRDLSKYVLEEGDVLFLSKGHRFEASVVGKLPEEREYITGNSITTLKNIDRKKYNPYFIAWYLGSEEALTYFEKFASGNMVKAVNKKVLSTLELPKISLEEQNKLINIARAWEIEKKATEEYLVLKERVVNEELLERVREG